MTIPTRYPRRDETGIFLVNYRDDLSAATCDVILVHGFQGGAASTWTHDNTGALWVEDFLPMSIRDEFKRNTARIWACGYHSSVWQQYGTVRNHATNILSQVKDIRRGGHENKKIIWICHSLGGILVKQALVDAKINSQYRSIEANTVGVVFLGTPHSGSAMANLPSLVLSIVKTLGPSDLFNSATVRGLRPNDASLFTLAGQFANAYSDIAIHSYYETVPYKGKIIVSEYSAILQTSNEHKTYGMDANHKEMVRFRNLNDSNWIELQKSILQLMEIAVAASITPGTPTSLPSPTPGTTGPNSSASVYSQFGPSRPPYPTDTQSAPPQPGNYNPSRQRIPTAQSYPGPSATTASSSRAPDPKWPPPPAAARSGAFEERIRTPHASLNQQASRLDLRAGMSATQTFRVPASASSNPAPSHPAPRFFSGGHIEPGEDDHRPGAFCDNVGCAGRGIRRPIKLSEVRVKCNVCIDYDLCLSCYQSGQTSGNHKVDHSVCIIKRTRIIDPENMLHSEAANPQISNPANPSRLNWMSATVKEQKTNETKTIKYLRLFKNNSQSRFLMDLKPGNYIVELKLKFEFYPKCGKQALDVIRSQGAGIMVATMGTVTDQREFRRGQYSALGLTSSLLRNMVAMKFDIPKGDILYSVNFKTLMRVSGADHDIPMDIGLILQWIDVPEFSSTDSDAVVQTYVDQILLYDVVNHSEQISREPPNNTPRQIGSVDQVIPANNDDDDGNDEDTQDTLKKYVTLYLLVQQEPPGLQRQLKLYALAEKIKELKEEAQKEEIARAIIAQATAAARQRQEQEQEKEAAAAFLGLLFNGMNMGR